MEWLPGRLPSGERDTVARGYPDPAETSLGEAGLGIDAEFRAGICWDRGKGILGRQNSRPLTAEEEQRCFDQPQRSPLTRRLGDGALPSGARQGSLRVILLQKIKGREGNPKCS